MVKELLKSLREYKKSTILTPVFVGLEVIMELVIPFFMASLIDNGIDKGNMSHVLKIGILLVVFAVLSLVFGMISGRHSSISSVGFATNLRHDMYHKVQDFSFSNIDKFSTASIVTRLTTDVTNVQMAFMMITRIAMRSPLALVFALIMSFSINAKIALIYLIATPFLGLGLWLILSKVHPTFRMMFRTYDELNSVVQENVHGIRVVKSFVREDHERQKFNGVSKKIFDYSVKAHRLLAFNMPLMQLTIYVCMLLASWFGARLIVGGELTTGQLTSVMTYAMSILSSLMMLSMAFAMITMARTSAQRIVEVLTEEPDIKDPENPIFKVEDGSISFRGAAFSYARDPNKLCLLDVDLDIASGETVGIIGGTGSSKSTLVQLIPRLYDVTGGQVMVGGRDVRDYDLKALREDVAMVLQKNELFSGTIKENLRWGSESASDDELIEACRLAQADEFISKMPDGYDTYIEQGGTNVSGGQKQRLCIARALLKKPKILILDDSTSAVDTATDAMIRQAFRDSIPDTTKLIIAQRISSVMDADKIVVMDNGRIDAVGTHDELMESSKIYREVFLSQQKGGVDNG